MSALYFNTSNRDKVKEIKVLFNDCKRRIAILDYKVTEILSIDIRSVILHKAKEAYRVAKVPVIVEHGGLEIEYLNGYPGGLSKPMWDTLNDKICDLLPRNHRKATAISAVCFCDGKERKVFIGKTQGKISLSGKGNNGFQWDPIFIPEDADATYAEMDLNQKLEYSQAARAYKQLRKYLNV